MHLLSNKQNMDDLAARAVALGRQVADWAKSLHLGNNARDVAFVSRCLGRLKERQPFDTADEGGFDAVMDILDRSIAAECLGSEDRFEETGYDEFGPRGETRKRRSILIAAMSSLSCDSFFRIFSTAAKMCLIKLRLIAVCWAL